MCDLYGASLEEVTGVKVMKGDFLFGQSFFECQYNCDKKGNIYERKNQEVVWEKRE